MAYAPIASAPHRLRHLALNLVFFNACYLLANAAAQRQMIQRHLAMSFEAQIPFLPWMIVPYLSSGLFFCLGFAWVRSADQLRVLSQRLLLATVLASYVFWIYPLQFSWPRPAIDNPVWALLFHALSLVDRPYNQLPSLHVAFCLIFWQSLQATVTSRAARVLLALWLFATAGATVFTYQHHVWDVAGGLVLGGTCLAVIRPGRTEPNVAFYYLMGSAAVFLIGVLLGHSAWAQCLALYLALSLLLVGYAYFRRNRFFLGKHNGRLPFTSWLAYGPYLLGYWLTWQAVRWRERHKNTLTRMTDQLWIGRRLSDSEARQLPPGCTVLDLSNELNETPALRAHRYLHIPLLDLASPPADACRQVMANLDGEIRAGHVVYLHCSMGYSRSKLLADMYLAHSAP